MTGSGYPPIPSWCLELFREASSAVPAYSHFLQTLGCDPFAITGASDFDQIPVVTKHNYLEVYPLRELLWKGSFENARIISTSSGSSGAPFYWPRGDRSDQEAVRLNESIFEHFGTRGRPTLCINAFAMGTYIAATYELGAVQGLAQDGHQITIICPSIDIEDNVRILRELAPEFSQTIVMGYPPLVRDVLEAAHASDVPLKELNLHLVFAGENFSEQWRERVHDTAGISNPLTGSLSIYGTADAGIIGVESPLTVHVRQLAASNDDVKRALFPGCEILPSFVEVDPSMRYLEEIDGDIVFSAWNTLPLIRYRIGDQGRVLTLQDLIALLADEFGHSLPPELLTSSGATFVAIYGRADVAATFYSVNIYPENIKEGLESPKVEPTVTGKFLLANRELPGGHETLNLLIELARDSISSPQLRAEIEESVLASLLRNNAEFRRLHQSLGSGCRPTVELAPNGDPTFKIDIKHRWTAPNDH